MVDNFEFQKNYVFGDLVNIVALLRGEGGCPWDAVQTHITIKKDLIEETYEVIEAINKDDKALLCEELGDLMLQVVFHSQIETEAECFNIDDICDGICKKLIERHPHVFGEVNVDGVEDVPTNWDDIKRRTKGQKTTTQAMQAVPRELPALMRSTKIQKKAKKAGLIGMIFPVLLISLRKRLRSFVKQSTHRTTMPASMNSVMFFSLLSMFQDLSMSMQKKHLPPQRTSSSTAFLLLNSLPKKRALI